MKQKEYQLALQEYQKILTTYERSSHLADTLKEMAIAEDFLKKSEQASRHRQLLSSLLPLSPAASELSSFQNEKGSNPATSEVPLTAPLEGKLN